MTDTNTGLNHKGIPIMMTPAGRFYADTKNGRIIAPSVSGLRSKLNKASVFTPFKAFTIDGYHAEEIREHLVIGIEKKSRWPGLHFKTERGSSLQKVYEDTPANRKIAEEYIRKHKAFSKLEKKHEADQEKLLERITERTPAPEGEG